MRVVPKGDAEGGRRGSGEGRGPGGKGTTEPSAYTRRKTFSHLTLSGRLSTRIKIAYALPVFANFSLNFMVGVYALDFYVSLGANLAFLLFFTALARSFDVITAPLMAWITDFTRGTKWNILGRRRPYMLTGCIPYGVLFVLLFSSPRRRTGACRRARARWAPRGSARSRRTRCRPTGSESYTSYSS